MTEPATTSLLDTARAALERYHDVQVDDDGALSFQHGDVPCFVQGLKLADGLVVLNLMCVVAWDLADDETLPRQLVERAGEGLFGALGAVQTDKGWDVTVRYAFPGAGLDEEPMATLLMLVVAAASQLRTELLTG
jgi:hypothetical protein